MSLTSFLRDEEVKKLFSDSFNVPSNKILGDIKAPVLTDKYALIGTAFDYLLRFHLQYHNQDSITKMWVAEKSCQLMKDRVSDDIYSKAKNQLDFAKASYQQFLTSGVLTDELLESTIMLAHLDIYFRAGENEYLKSVEIESSDIQDLKNLISIVDFNQFEAKSHCILNPSFNGASILVGGADADIVIDNKLIDIKTTKYLSVKRDWFNQVIGYYVLGLMGGIGKQNLDGSAIDKIGFYFSRHGILHLYDVKDVVDFNTLPDFMEKMKNIAEKKMSSRREYQIREQYSEQAVVKKELLQNKNIKNSILSKINKFFKI